MMRTMAAGFVALALLAVGTSQAQAHNLDAYGRTHGDGEPTATGNTDVPANQVRPHQGDGAPSTTGRSTPFVTGQSGSATTSHERSGGAATTTRPGQQARDFGGTRGGN